MIDQNHATRLVNSDTVQDISNRFIFLVNKSTLTGFHDIETPVQSDVILRFLLRKCFVPRNFLL